MENKNTLTEAQKAFLTENFRKMTDRELYQKLNEIGPETDEQSFSEWIHEAVSKAEKDVFSRNVSEEELESTAGGALGGPICADGFNVDCRNVEYRDIYKNGFPNCASTVEDGSWCWSADACYAAQVEYQNMNDCSKAWK